MRKTRTGTQTAVPRRTRKSTPPCVRIPAVTDATDALPVTTRIVTQTVTVQRDGRTDFGHTAASPPFVRRRRMLSKSSTPPIASAAPRIIIRGPRRKISDFYVGYNSGVPVKSSQTISRGKISGSPQNHRRRFYGATSSNHRLISLKRQTVFLSLQRQKAQHRCVFCFPARGLGTERRMRG